MEFGEFCTKRSAIFLIIKCFCIRTNLSFKLVKVACNSNMSSQDYGSSFSTFSASNSAFKKWGQASLRMGWIDSCRGKSLLWERDIYDLAYGEHFFQCW